MFDLYARYVNMHSIFDLIEWISVVFLRQYLDDFKVKNLVSRYSEFINFPIKIWSSKTTYEQARTALHLLAALAEYTACPIQAWLMLLSLAHAVISRVGRGTAA